MVYGQILNFGSENLSNLDTILLLGAINTCHLDSNGFDRIIIPIFERINHANNGSKYNIKISFFAGDTPASQSLGGFIEAVGNARFPCRECFIEKKELLIAKSENDCQMREYEQTKEQSLEGIAGKGIKRRTELYNYSFFNVLTSTPQDPMHIVLEGVARRLVIDFFKVWLDLKRVDLRELNSVLKNFKYGALHKADKIKIKLKEHDMYKKDLIISASQMKNLLLLFPLIFHDIVDLRSNDYKLLNCLRKITMIAFDYSPTNTMIDSLEIYIKALIILWEKYYGIESGFPKIHYLVHLPKWIRK